MTFGAEQQTNARRAWMRRASSTDLVSLLRADPTALRDLTPIAGWLGCTVLEIDEAGGSVVAEYDVGGDARNPWGHVHGGARCSAVDEIATLAAAIRVGPKNFAGTLGLNITFIRPLQARVFRVHAQVTDRSLSLMSVRAQIRDGDGRCCDDAMVTVALRSPLAGRPSGGPSVEAEEPLTFIGSK